MAESTVSTAPPPAESGIGYAIKSRVFDVGFWADWASVVGLVGLFILFSILTPESFLSGGNMQGILIAAAILIILTVGQTFAIVTGGIDLSISSNMTLGAVVFGALFADGHGIWLCCLAAVAASGAVGIFNGVLIAKGKVQDFIITLGTLSAASGLALVLSGGQPVTIINGFMLRLSTHGLRLSDTFLIGWSVVTAIVVAVVAHFILFNTRFGTHIFAVGGSAEAARATGISADRIKIAVYTFAGVCAGIASILLIARVSAAQPAMNTQFVLNAVAAVVLGGVSLMGGKGNIIGPVFGALLITTLTNGLTLLAVSQFYQPLAVGLVVVLAALLTRFQR